MNKSHIIGALVDAGTWMALGVFILFFLPKYYQKRVELGKEKTKTAENVKHNVKLPGWVLIAVGVFKLVAGFLP